MNLKIKLSLETTGIVALLLISMASSPILGLVTPPLTKTDFQASSFNKVVDFVDFARARAADEGIALPSAYANMHAYVDTVWINTTGMQLFYAGMVNMSNNGPSFTIPMQSFMEHFKSPEGKDVLVSSSFLTLLAFQEGSNTIYANSPDRNDTIYASFSLGLPLPMSGGPRQNNTATVVPLTSSSDGLQWKWGMSYTNLTAVWWRVNPDPENPTWDPVFPVAVTTYQQLAFNYTLTLDPTTKTASLSSSFIVGALTNLFVVDWSHIIPRITHYNDTGSYALNGTKIGTETVHQFATINQFKLSIVLFQSAVVISHTVESDDDSGQNTTDTSRDVSSGAITTSTNDNEQVFKTDFGTKAQYQLYNSTSGQTSTYNAVTRTTQIHGYSDNHAFDVQVFFIRLMAYAIIAFHPGIWLYHDDLDIAKANFVYTITYPTWGGYKVIHDPTYTAYYSPSVAAPISAGMLALVGIAAIAVLGGAVVFSRRRHVNLPASPAAAQ